MVTIFGGSIKTLSNSAVFLLWGTLTPPLNFAIAFVNVSIDKPPLWSNKIIGLTPHFATFHTPAGLFLSQINNRRKMPKQ
jgi:hypothetical protein